MTSPERAAGAASSPFEADSYLTAQPGAAKHHAAPGPQRAAAALPPGGSAPQPVAQAGAARPAAPAPKPTAGAVAPDHAAPAVTHASRSRPEPVRWGLALSGRRAHLVLEEAPQGAHVGRATAFTVDGWWALVDALGLKEAAAEDMPKCLGCATMLRHMGANVQLVSP